MKTPMQMLIDDLKEMSSAAHITHRAGLDYAIEIANNLLEEEKKQIMDAWDRGQYIGMSFPQRFIDNNFEQDPESYYNQKYNNENGGL